MTSRDTATQSISATRAATDEEFYGRAAMNWYGWGSPVGIAAVFIGVGVFLVLARIAIMGF